MKFIQLTLTTNNQKISINFENVVYFSAYDKDAGNKIIDQFNETKDLFSVLGIEDTIREVANGLKECNTMIKVISAEKGSYDIYVLETYDQIKQLVEG